MNEDRDEARDLFPQATQSGRATSPLATGLRQRPLGRAATVAEGAPQLARRSSSFVSETISESRRSFKSSTDDLFLPRVDLDHDPNLESSHWHSLPLGLALLPAVGGLFFQNGSAFITDISLLGLAALFLNWAVRLPWCVSQTTSLDPANDYAAGIGISRRKMSFRKTKRRSSVLRSMTEVRRLRRPERHLPLPAGGQNSLTAHWQHNQNFESMNSSPWRHVSHSRH